MDAKDAVVLGHGSGGKMSHELIVRLFLPELGEAAPRFLDDAAIITTGAEKLALTTDSHVISPLFFPGGDIGRLAICGTINDLAMVGAKPLALTSAFIIEEGLPFSLLREIVHSMKKAAEEAGVFIAAGDTKVVRRGEADGLFINTTGLGKVPEHVSISGKNARQGDVVIISGTIGDHGIAVLSKREDIGFETELISDVAPLNHMVEKMLTTGDIHVLRDPTRGGLATSLVEICEQSNVTIEITEEAIPIRPPVKAACEMLGYDPLYIANEGKLVALVAEQDAAEVLAALQKDIHGKDAAIIGRVTETGKPQLRLKTSIGGTRIMDMLPGEMLPRIC